MLPAAVAIVRERSLEFAELWHFTRDTPLTRMAGDTRIWRTNGFDCFFYNPSRDDFAAMLDESFAGAICRKAPSSRIVVAIEKDMAVIDVGLKTEGRVALREFNGPGREADLKVGDEVEVFLDRIEMRSAKPCCRATRRAARKAGASSKKPSTTTRRCTASSSTRSGRFYRRS